VSPAADPRSTTSSQLKLIQDLNHLSRDGRSIVPLLGAGISIEAGIPSLEALTRYLAKVQLYIRKRLYRPAEELDGSTNEEREPSEYIRDFGWPDRNQLEADLWMWLANGGAERNHFGDRRQRWMDRLVQGEVLEHFKRLDQGLAGKLQELQKCASRVEAAIAELDEVGSRPGSVPEAWLQVYEHSCIQLPSLLRDSSWNLRGNYWKGLLSHLTRANPDYVDTLFQQLIQGRQPATSHRYLAFLTGVFRLRVFLTTNFDSLLEDALRMEGFQPSVYEALEGYPLPHPSLVHKGLSVIKLHGGAFGLLVGDQLDRPLDEESKARLHAYLPNKPVLLVLGMGGWDLRVLDLMELVIDNGGDLFWLHFEKELQGHIKRRFHVDDEDPSNSNPRFHHCRVRDPGAFLKELFSRRTEAHPASRYYYRAYDQRPIPEDPATTGGAAPDPCEDAPIRFFVDLKQDEPDESGSRRLAAFVAGKAGSHSPVWIDLESKATLDDLVADITAQLRRYDTSLPPAILTVDTPTERRRRGEKTMPAFDKTIRRLFHTLRRGRYILAFDGVGSFGRPPLQHHGFPEAPEKGAEEPPPGGADDCDKKRLPPGTAFLLELVSKAHGEHASQSDDETLLTTEGLGHSILAFSVDLQRLRKQDRVKAPNFWECLQKQASRLKDLETGRYLLCSTDLKKQPAEGETRGRDILSSGDESTYRDALLLLCAFRRRRSFVALRRLLPKYLAMADSVGPTTEESVEDFLAWCEESRFMIRVEGGYYSIARRIRNDLYWSAQERTRSEELRQDLIDGASSLPGSEQLETLDELATLAAIHQDVAEYYQELYAASREVPALLEHFYHRVSSIRYLTKLDAWSPALGNTQLEQGKAPRLKRLFPQPESSHAPGAAAESGASDLVPDEGLLKDDGSLDREALRLMRWRMIRALRGTFWREREKLLGEVPELTLLSWTEALRENVRRFMARTALHTEAEVQAELFGKKEEPADEAARLAANIRKVLRELWDDLDRIEADVHEARLDSVGVLKVRGPALARLVEKPISQDRVGEELEKELAWIFSPEPWEDHLREVDRRRRFPLIETQKILFQLANTYRKTGQRERAAQLLKVMGCLVEPNWSSAGKKSDEDLARIYPKLHEAEIALNDLSPWKRQVEPIYDLDKQKTKGGVAARLCDRALDILEWVQEEDRTLRSYLHSLKGRGHYLGSEFRQAFREFDLAHASLSATKGKGAWEARAQAHAISYLRHAEALMLRADERILDWCRRAQRHKAQEDGAPARKPPPELKRCLASWEHTDLADLEDWEQSRFNRDLVEGEPERFADTIIAAQQRLSSAWDLLELAQRHLDDALRNLEWSSWLAQLRAEFHVQRLLLQITDGFPQDRPSESGRSTNHRGRQIGTLLNDLRLGLRAIRQGLDIILPDVSVRDRAVLLKDKRLQQLLRLWLELMVCGAYRTRMIGTDSDRNGQLSVESLWRRWTNLNALEAYARLPRTTGVQTWIMEKDESLPSASAAVKDGSPKRGVANHAAGIAARAKCLQLILECTNPQEELSTALVGQLCRR